MDAEQGTTASPVGAATRHLLLGAAIDAKRLLAVDWPLCWRRAGELS